MAGNLIVVDGCTFLCTPPSASASIDSSVKSTKVKCSGHEAYFSIIVKVSQSGYTDKYGTFTGASTKVKGSGTAFVLANQTVTVILTQSSTPFSTLSVVVSFATAGQTKVKAV